MLASIQKYVDGYVAKFERQLQHPADEVWSYLTENKKLNLWFPELSVDEIREGGVIRFDMGDGSFEELTILEVKPLSVLEFTWDKDCVRFELHPWENGCQLLLIERLTILTDHTPRDLAGWHVCLDVIEALLDGWTIESRKNEWEKRYKQYREATSSV
jgi:uncharacterized protein YndB with AHSA1/START domain